MEVNFDQVLEAALKLPIVDRLELAEALSASVASEDRPEFDEALKTTVLRRGEEIRSGKVVPIPWSEVQRQAREIVGVENLLNEVEPLDAEWLAEIDRRAAEVAAGTAVLFSPEECQRIARERAGEPRDQSDGSV